MELSDLSEKANTILGFLNKNKNDESEKKAGFISHSNKKGPPFLTLDIGSSELKIMVADYKHGKIIIKHVMSEELPDNAVLDGKIIEEGYIVDSIKKMMNMNKIKVSGVVITMNSSEVIQREIVVPKVSDSELQGLVAYEIEKHLPIDSSSYVVQYNQIEEFKNESGVVSTRINVCAMPKAMAKKQLGLISKLKLKPIALDIHQNSIAKLIQIDVQNNTSMSRGSNVVVDMGHKHFNIMLFNGGKLLFSRLIETGGSRIDGIITRIANVSFAEAGKLKKYNLSKLGALDMYRAYSAVDTNNLFNSSFDKEELIMQETTALFESWITDIDGVIKYYLSKDSRNTIDAIYIYAGSSYIREIDKLIESRLNIATKKLNHFNFIEGDFDGSKDELLKYLNNIGATVRL